MKELISNEFINRIRDSKSNAEARRYIMTALQKAKKEQLTEIPKEEIEERRNKAYTQELQPNGKTEQFNAEEFLKSKVIEWKTSMSYYYSFSGHELADLLEEYSKQNNDDFQLQRLYDWLMNEKREPAKTKFTAGTLRNVANEIEFRLNKSNWISELDHGDYLHEVLQDHFGFVALEDDMRQIIEAVKKDNLKQ